MPELAEVELSRRVWAVAEGQALVGIAGHAATRIYRDCSLARLKRALKGAVLLGSRAHGKRMFFKFSAGGNGEVRWLELHLGMAGRLARSEPGAKRH
ncbi:MAG: DNA-formamidopyrimidine glycosylase family protein, partial [Opitutales bacterium]